MKPKEYEQVSEGLRKLEAQQFKVQPRVFGTSLMNTNAPVHISKPKPEKNVASSKIDFESFAVRSYVNKVNMNQFDTQRVFDFDPNNSVLDYDNSHYENVLWV